MELITAGDLRSWGYTIGSEIPNTAWIPGWALAGDRFLEISAYWLTRVMHLQWNLSMGLSGSDFSMFRYYSQDQLETALHPYFKYDVIIEARSIYFVARPRY